MREFKELDKRSVNEVQKDILKHWKEENILAKTTKGDKEFVFYDGPIYANAKPGIHHVLAKAIKDSFTKYKIMNGYHILRKIGLDTHGLPIEVNVEKKLGFKSKADIEKFGVENFCKECNKNTALNIDEVNHLTDLMGQFIDCAEAVANHVLQVLLLEERQVGFLDSSHLVVGEPIGRLHLLYLKEHLGKQLRIVYRSLIIDELSLGNLKAEVSSTSRRVAKRMLVVGGCQEGSVSAAVILTLAKDGATVHLHFR